MTSIKQIQALKESLIKQINKAFEPLLNVASVVVEDVASEPEEAVKLTPRQKLEKQLATAEEKLEKLNEKIAGGKSKIPDKDEENKTKLEEKISEINDKISELDAKEATKAAPKPAKAAAKKVAKEAPEPAAKAEKHVPRITPAMTTKLKEAFETVGVDWDDKYKKDFVTHVNSLSDEQFAEFGLEGHMSQFANTQAPAAEGGAGQESAPEVKTLTVADLVKQKKNLTQVSAGVFRHKTTGEMVTGPAEDPDEDFEDKEHDGNEYIVGETTKRVYKPSTGGPDEFVGYWGIGDW